MDRKRTIILAGVIVVALAAVVILWRGIRRSGMEEDLLTEELEENAELLYGLDTSGLDIEEGVIRSGQTISTIFNGYGISPARIDVTARAADSVFNLRNIRAGKNYTAFVTDDSLRRLVHFVYEHTLTEYLVISYANDSIDVRKETKDVTVDRKVGKGEITSSLWNSMVNGGMSPALASDLENIYAWTVDFFALQKGDHFTVIYDEKIVDSTSVGVGQIWGALFHHNGKDYYAIPFKQGDKLTYWDENGNSLRKGMLKAPLNYSRISSKFSNSRMHPVLRVRRPHHGVDYAAPAGTPVMAVADGNIIFRGWDSKGGGNTLKIKHSASMTTGYLHLRGFAPGIENGKRVSQGDVIGYVGSTGTSTGPHLDYRVWINGKAVDPLKVTSEPAEPISNENISAYREVRDRVMAELRGTIPDSMKVIQLDSLDIYLRHPIDPGSPELPDSIVNPKNALPAEPK